jgi:hypothetical protein
VLFNNSKKRIDYHPMATTNHNIDHRRTTAPEREHLRESILRKAFAAEL